MVNKALMQAIKNETKTLQQQGFDKIEKQFIKDNWEMFSESKLAVNGAFRDPSVTNGTEMLAALGIQGVTIHRVITAPLRREPHRKESELPEQLNLVQARHANRQPSFIQTERLCEEGSSTIP